MGYSLPFFCARLFLFPPPFLFGFHGGYALWQKPVLAGEGKRAKRVVRWLGIPPLFLFTLLVMIFGFV